MCVSLIQRLAAFLVALLALAACGSAGSLVPDAVALSDPPPAVADVSAPELVSGPAQGISTATPEPAIDPTPTSEPSTAPAASPVSSSIGEPLDPPVCVKGDDFPDFEGAVAVVNADMDGDDELDQVFLLAERQGLGYSGWVAVAFAQGGMATGKYKGFFEPTPAHGLQVVELTNGGGTAPEILFVASRGPAIAQTAVMTLADCRVDTTTLHREPFRVSTGATAVYTSSGGCAYGTGGRLEFDVTEQRPASGQWNTNVFTLDGSTWTRVGGYDYRDFPELETPTALTFDDCTGLILAE